jgi:peptidoglycan/LPS O-acetylase OafA/YrhL
MRYLGYRMAKRAVRLTPPCKLALTLLILVLAFTLQPVAAISNTDREGVSLLG